MPRLAAFPHQIQAVQNTIIRLRGHGGAYVSHSPGLGKSRTALAVARLLGLHKVLIVCPPVALGVWEREIEKWQPGVWAVERYHGAEPLYAPGADGVILTTYTSLAGVTKQAAKRLDAVTDWAPDLVIFDEAHALKSPTSKTSKVLSKLALTIPYRLLLSGTPAHTPLDYWAQYRIVAPGDPYWQQKFPAVRERIAILAGPHRAWVKGFKGPETADMIDQHVLPYTDVVAGNVLNLPEPIETIVPVKLGVEERRVYDQMKRDMLAQLASGEVATAENVLAQMTRLQQITSGFIKTELNDVITIGESKYRALEGLLEERQSQNTVVAARFRYDCSVLEVLWPTDADYVSLGVINGDTPAAERTVLENLFQKPVDGCYLTLQYQAGGVAITLSKAHALIFYSLPFSVIQFEQMKGRVWRPGQTGHVQILYLLAEDTIDEDIYEALQAKRDVVDLARRLLHA